MRGRKKIELSETEKEKRFETGKRIRYLREKAGLSQTKLAEMVHCSRQQIGFYEKGNNPVPPGIAEDMAKIFHVIPPYITCESNEISWKEWYSEQERIEGAALTQISEEQAKEIERKQILFSLCGFHYEYLEGASYDFASLSSKPDKEIIYASEHPHQLTSFTDPKHHYYFNEAELNNLLEELHNTIGYVCYKNGVRK